MEIPYNTNICFETPLFASSLLIIDEIRSYIAARKHQRGKIFNSQGALS